MRPTEVLWEVKLGDWTATFREVKASSVDEMISWLVLVRKKDPRNIIGIPLNL